MQRTTKRKSKRNMLKDKKLINHNLDVKTLHFKFNH